MFRHPLVRPAFAERSDRFHELGSSSETHPETAASCDRQPGALAGPAACRESAPPMAFSFRSAFEESGVGMRGSHRRRGPTPAAAIPSRRFSRPQGVAPPKSLRPCFVPLTLFGFNPFRAFILPEVVPARRRNHPSPTSPTRTVVPPPVRASAVPDCDCRVPEGLVLPESRARTPSHLQGQARASALLVVARLRGPPGRRDGTLRSLRPWSFSGAPGLRPSPAGPPTSPSQPPWRCSS